MGYYTHDEAAEEVERDLEGNWHGAGRYRIRFGDGGQSYDPVWYDSPEELADDLLSAYGDATETHLPYVEALPSKAEFRARREALGLSQTDVAEEVFVQTRTVKRWEDPTSDYWPTDDAWEYLEDCETDFEKAVNEAAGIVKKTAKDRGKLPKTVTFTYWRTQQQYDELRGDGGRFGMANAIARKTAERVRELGCEPRLEYPESGANIYHEAARDLGAE